MIFGIIEHLREIEFISGDGKELVPVPLLVTCGLCV
jgi:hypothetical protein